MRAPCRPADRFEHAVRVKVDGAAGGYPTVQRLGDLCRCPNQNVGVPDRSDAEFRVGADFHPDIADTVFDRRKAWFLGQAEKRPFHGVALVANRYIREIRAKQVGLSIALGRDAFRHGPNHG